MAPELEKQIAEILKSAHAVGKDAYSFLQEQAPDLVRQILAWEKISTTTWLVLWVVLFVISSIVGCVLLKKHNPDSCDEWHVGAYSVWVTSSLFYVPGIVMCSLHLVKLATAPKLVLLSFLKNL